MIVDFITNVTNNDGPDPGNSMTKYEAPPTAHFKEEDQNMKIWYLSQNCVA